MTSSTPKKGDLIINPSTQRPVKIGSRTWLNLVKKGLVEGRYSDPNELYEIKEPTEIEGKIEELNKTLPRDQQAVRGRGKYKNKIVRRQKRPNPQELTEYTAKTAARTIAKNVDNLDSYDDLETELEKMILAEMMIGEPQETRRVRRGQPKTIPDKQEKYYAQEPEEYDEGEGDEEEENDLIDNDEKQFYEYE